MKERMTLLDMSRWIKTGEGANGASYDNVEDSSLMVKLYNPSYDTSAIVSEQEVAANVFALGVPSPRPGELVTDGERVGIMFRRIVGKRSFSRMLADEPHRTEEFAHEVARLCRDLHRVECPDGMFPEAREQFLGLLSHDKVLSASERRRFGEFIAALPDSRTALHGDMHFGNIISTLKPGEPLDSPHETYFIDLGYFSRGFPLIDLGMMMLICIISDDEFRRHDFHVDGKLTAVFWNHFIERYFLSGDREAASLVDNARDVESVTRVLAPYACMKMLLVEYNLGGVLPENYDRFIHKTISEL